jgi:two-component system phosphate regulon response regulator PhoB
MTSPAVETVDPVLIIDDEPDLARLLVFNLQQAGFAVESATTGGDGLAAARRVRPVVIVLDLMLPDIGGLEVCRRLRADASLGDPAILMLTARSEEADRVVGFEVGADDYVVKPYGVREVVARVRTLARRAAERRTARAPGAPEGTRLRWRGLEVDPARHVVVADGHVLDLRPMEFKLLATFLERPGVVLSRDQLLDEVWGITADVSTRTVDTHIRRLRARLGSYGDAIETVHGFGYKLREP